MPLPAPCLALLLGALAGSDGSLERVPVLELLRRARSSGPEGPEHAELARRMEEPVVPFTDDEWRELLLETGVIELPERWPAGRRIPVAGSFPRWLGNAEVRFRVCGAVEWSGLVGRLSPPCLPTSAVHLSALPAAPDPAPGPRTLRFQVEVERGAPPGTRPIVDSWLHGPECDVVWRGELALEVPVERLDRVLPSVGGPEVDRAVAESLRVLPSTGEPSLVFGPPMAEGFLADTAVSLSVEAVRDGQPVADLGELVGREIESERERHRVFVGDWLRLDELPSPDEHLLLRFTSTSTAALRSPVWRRRYVGSFVVPLAELRALRR